MMISLSDAGKRFNREWIFRHVTYTFEKGQSYAVTGPNGSGKSTLLQAISGAMDLSEGKMIYEVQGAKYDIKGAEYEDGSPQKKLVVPEQIFSQVSICAPYLELVEEMTLREFLHFHHGFKPFLTGMTTDNIIGRLGLEKAATKQIRYYSSGMKQRVKLAQCIFSDVPVLLLDEPCTNLDVAGVELYLRLINEYCADRLVIVCSNDETEYDFCKQKINILEWK